LVNYIYKFLAAIVLTPLIYLAHYCIRKYVGAERAHQMQMEAVSN